MKGFDYGVSWEFQQHDTTDSKPSGSISKITLSEEKLSLTWRKKYVWSGFYFASAASASFMISYNMHSINILQRTKVNALETIIF